MVWGSKILLISIKRCLISKLGDCGKSHLLFGATFFVVSLFQPWTFGKQVRVCPSWGLQSLIYGRDTVVPNVRWVVGDGKSIKIREDRWLPVDIIRGTS